VFVLRRLQGSAEMVLGGQDAWRKHPLFTGNWKKPFPGLGIAVGLFGFYLVGEYVWSKTMIAPPSRRVHGPKVHYKEAGDLGDAMPEAKLKGGHH